MASSSLSQESLDIDDYNIATRRSRSRPIRSRVCIHKNESIETDERDLEEELDSFNERKENQDLFPMHSSFVSGIHMGEHDSPTRIANRAKDKRGRLNHMHKGKTVKDKRKLREKRRSTGVVHLASTESTGDSLDEEGGTNCELQTRRNTSHNEVIDADNPQTPEEDRKSFTSRRNKSPSDLDADLEDNQDYDSTVSQSETNLTIIGQPQPIGVQDYHMGAAPEVLRPSAQFNQTVPEASFTSPLHNNSPKRHVAPRAADGRVFGMHYREGDVVGADTCRGMLKRTNAHDGMEARLLAKTVELEKILDKEREEKRLLQELLDERDHKIAQLEKELALLNNDLDTIDDENEKLQQENRVLLRAMATLSVQ